LSRILFSGSIALNAGLLSLLLLVCAGPFMRSGEFWEGLAFLWVFSLPAVVVSAGVRWRVYPRYVAIDGIQSRLTLYVGLVVATTVGAPGITYLVLALVSLIGALHAA
jgi:hypothetical protein